MNTKPLIYDKMIAGRVTNTIKENFIKFKEDHNYNDSQTLRELLTIAFKNNNEDVNTTNHNVNTIKIPSNLQEKYHKLNIPTMEEIIHLRNRINPKTNKEYSFRKIAELIGTGLKITNEFYNDFNKEILIKK